MKRRRADYKIFLILSGLMSTFTGVGGLRNVAVTIPTAVSPGDTVTLKCHYDLENDPLYTVKWYKGRQEFFRYIPKELPHTRVFPLQGVNVDVSKSGANEVVLRDVQFEIAGKYRCEVSADAPSFHTSMVASYMHVVYLPEGQPKMTMEKQRYSVGDILRGNCSSPPSNPPTNLTWFVNDRKMNDSFPVRIPVEESLPPPKPKQELLPENNGVGIDGENIVDANGLEFPVENHERKVTVIGLELDIDGSNFQYGKMRIECRATMFQLYSSTVELVLDEEKPRLASVLGTRESSLGKKVMTRLDMKLEEQKIYYDGIIRVLSAGNKQLKDRIDLMQHYFIRNRIRICGVLDTTKENTEKVERLPNGAAKVCGSSVYVCWLLLLPGSRLLLKS